MGHESSMHVHIQVVISLFGSTVVRVALERLKRQSWLYTTLMPCTRAEMRTSDRLSAIVHFLSKFCGVCLSFTSHIQTERQTCLFLCLSLWMYYLFWRVLVMPKLFSTTTLVVLASTSTSIFASKLEEAGDGTTSKMWFSPLNWILTSYISHLTLVFWQRCCGWYFTFKVSTWKITRCLPGNVTVIHSHYISLLSTVSEYLFW